MDNTWQTMMTAVLAVFGVIGVGAFCRKANWLTEEADRTLLKLVIRLLLPALIFHFILGDPRLREPANMLWPPLIGFSIAATGFLASLGIARLMGKHLKLPTAPHRRTFALCTGLQNYGYIPIPLAAALFPDSKSTIGVLLIHNVGIEIAIWTVGIFILSGELGKGWWRKLINPPIIAIFAALTLNYLHLNEYIPAFASNGIAMLGQCAIPVALLLIGATICDHFAELKFFRHGPVILGSSVLRLAVFPVLMLVVAMALPSNMVDLRRVLALEAAMPAAVFPIVLARHYHGDTHTAVRVVIGSSILSLLTMPIWISAGLKLLNLLPG